MKRQWLLIAAFIFASIGIFDTIYLTSEHYSTEIRPCSTLPFVDCGKVLKSEYSMIGPMPLAVLGLIFYSSLFGLLLIRAMLWKNEQNTVGNVLWSVLGRLVTPKTVPLSEILLLMQVLMTATGVLSSLYFVYLQLWVIGAICLFCMVSAINSFILFGVTMWEWKVAQKENKLGNRVLELFKKK